MRRPDQHPNSAANFTTANHRRSAAAADTHSLRAARALEILDAAGLPGHLTGTLRLRATHPGLGLADLADLAAVTKNAYASQLRRVLHLADVRAYQARIPNTHGVLEPVKSRWGKSHDLADIRLRSS